MPLGDYSGMQRFGQNLGGLSQVIQQQMAIKKNQMMKQKIADIYKAGVDPKTGQIPKQNQQRVLSQMYQVSPEAAMQYGTFLKSQEKEVQKPKPMESQKALGLMASKYLEMDPQEKIENFNNLRRGMKRLGIPEPKVWSEKTEYDSDVEFDLEMAAQSAGKGAAFAPTKLQKFVGEDGFMRNYNPATGKTSFALNEETGEKVAAQDYYVYKETDEGFVPMSTKRPPKKAPEPVENLTPAGKKKRELAEQQAYLGILQTNLAIDKATKDASMGGQFKPTQYAAAGFGIRINQVERELADLTAQGFDPSTLKNAVIGSSQALELIKDQKLKRYAQAMRNFINATLRRESGAAIADSEFDNANKQYFAQVGDGPEVLAQKKRNRGVIRAQMEAEAGGAWGEVMSKFDPKSAPTPSPSGKPEAGGKPKNMTDAEWKELQELEAEFGN